MPLAGLDLDADSSRCNSRTGLRGYAHNPINASVPIRRTARLPRMTISSSPAWIQQVPMGPDVAVHPDGVEEPLARLIVAGMDIVVLSPSWRETGAEYEIIEEAVENSIMRLPLPAVPSPPAAPHLARRSIFPQGCGSAPRGAASVSSISLTAADAREAADPSVTTSPSASPRISFYDVIAGIDAGQHRQAGMHVGDEFSRDVVGAVPGIQRQQSETALRVEARDLVRVDLRRRRAHCPGAGGEPPP